MRFRDWWHEVNQFCGVSGNNRQDIRSILKLNTESTDQELANHINEAFISAMKEYEPLENDVYVQHDDHESITVNEELIIKKLQQINTSKAGGPDNIPNRVLKTFSDTLAPLQSKAWKLANVTPLPKGTTIEDLNNDLRPISLTSALSKIAQACVVEQEIEP